ncbi:glycosyltransferase family 1 protein [Merismopedia glauca CCAP 1448/3]|uniref:Glycosyltransferase family 1 protein n=2 Tax=Merismopedia TaxID=53402 RepID=A0A2T1BX18_9CYAN|nr:glycosyltransferase family 1 protein [Merismopedia glauca CCAP 1448/3]
MLGASLDIQGGITSVEKLILENAPPELQIRHAGTFAPGSVIHNSQVFIKALWILLTTLITRKADLIHIHFSERGSTLRKIILIVVILAFRQPFILHAHGATYREFWEGLPSLLQKITVFLFAKCTRFVTLSESWRAYYLSEFKLDKDQTTVLYNPVKLPINIPQDRPKLPVRFVFLGLIGQRGGVLDAAKSVMKFPKQDKGAFDLIKAFAALPESDRNGAQLVLAGNGDLDLAQRLIKELGVEDKITISAWLSPAERDTLLAEANAFVLPSYNEGLPMSMLEAMAWGLPVIVTPVGGIPEVINHHQNGLLVQPGNKEELVQALQKIIRDEDLRISLGNAARSRVESLDIKNYISSLFSLYTSILK